MAYEIRVNWEHIWFEPLVSAELGDVQSTNECDWGAAGQLLQQHITTPSTTRWSIRRALLGTRARVLMWLLVVGSIGMIIALMTELLIETALIEEALNNADRMLKLKAYGDQNLLHLLDKKRHSISLRKIAGATMAVLGATALVGALAGWLCQWSEHQLRSVLRPTILNHVNRIIPPHYCVLLDVSLLENLNLTNFRRVKTLSVPVQSVQEEVRLLRGKFVSLTYRPGLVLYRLFITSPEILGSPAFDDTLPNIQKQLAMTLHEQKLKVLNFLRKRENMLLCWELFGEMEVIKGVQLALENGAAGVQPGGGVAWLPPQVGNMAAAVEKNYLVQTARSDSKAP